MHVYSKNFRGSPDGWNDLSHGLFLVGENSTGKSSFALLIEIIYSTEFQISNHCVVEKLFSHGFSDYFSKLSSSKKQKSFQIGFLAENKDENGSSDFVGKIATYIRHMDGGILLSSLTLLEENRLTNLTYKDEKMWKSQSSVDEKISTRSAIVQMEKTHESTSQASEFTLPIPGRPPAFAWNIFSQYSTEDIKIGEGLQLFQSTMSDKIRHFGPVRTKPKRVYYVASTKFDPEGNASLIKLNKSITKKTFKKELEWFGKSSGLFESIKIDNLSKNLGKPAFTVKFVVRGKSFYADELGFGVSQIMPIVVEVLIGSKDSILLMEQPELHLHPKAQAAFGELLYEFVAQGNRFIVETHSDFILDRFRIKIAENRSKEIASKILFFYHFRNKNRCKSINIGLDGGLMDPPKSYRKFFLKEELAKFDAI